MTSQLGPLHFRMQYTVAQRLSLDGGAELQFQVGGPHQIAVRLTASDSGADFIACWVEGVWDPKPQVGDAFESLAQHRLPEGSETLEGWPWDGHRLPDGSFEENLILPRGVLPVAIRSFLASASRELMSAGRRTIALLRWRTGENGPHDPFAVRTEEWSFDRQVWHRCPSSFQSRFEIVDPPEIGTAETEDIQSLIAEDDTEPIGHALYREAWSQRFQNRRSALVIGVAALEVGFKEFVVELAPQTKWLIENAPSPPVVKMLREFLPTLSPGATFSGEVLAPPKPVLKMVEDAVSARNLGAHVTGNAPADETLEEMLLAIRDVLWMLDYYRRRPWALQHMRVETRDALTRHEKSKSEAS